MRSGLSRKHHCTAILLAAGSGKRMGGGMPKQFLELEGRPLLWYALDAVERSELLDDCVLVAAGKEIPYVRERILERYGFRKVLGIAAGGAERYDSVRNGLEFLAELQDSCESGGGRTDYAFICDGARPFLTEEVLRRCYDAVRECGACAAAVPSKDTVKIADENGFVAETPARSRVWNVQTPQAFGFGLILDAYRRFGASRGESEPSGTRGGAPGRQRGASGGGQSGGERALSGEEWKGAQPLQPGEWNPTDDASLVERFTDRPVKLVMGDYRNIKVTTPDDLAAAKSFAADLICFPTKAGIS